MALMKSSEQRKRNIFSYFISNTLMLITCLWHILKSYWCIYI